MKKYILFLILALGITLILIGSLFFHVLYLHNFNKHTTPLSAAEQQEVLQILDVNIANLGDYSINIGDAYSIKDKEIVPVQLVSMSEHKRENYIIDLKEGVILEQPR